MAEEKILVPDLGGADHVDVIEILVNLGDQVEIEAPLMTLEGDKAMMDVPSPLAGQITRINVQVGDKVSAGDLFGLLETTSSQPQEKPTATPSQAAQAPTPEKKAKEELAVVDPIKPLPTLSEVYASPSVRRLAYELKIPLEKITGTGNKGRVTKEDIKRFLSAGKTTASLSPPVMPDIDFSHFGQIETQDLNKIKRATASNMQRNWLNIPHVTQFESADITDLEAYRKVHKALALEQNIRLTPIAFIIKAMVAALLKYPQFNASLNASAQQLILKKYCHIGVAVDTPHGLVVPVLRDADQKSVLEIAKELGRISHKARHEGLSLKEMQGGCMTISSLGGIGGNAFTPIINAPEVAILGVSKAIMQPVYDQDSQTFVPRLMLPLSLSYDHRVIDGAEAARFIVFLSQRLSDIKALLL